MMHDYKGDPLDWDRHDWPAEEPNTVDDIELSKPTEPETPA